MATVAARQEVEAPEYGPALQACNPMQREFVIAYVMCGVGSKAVKLAGYGRPHTTNAVYARLAYQLLQKDNVRAAVAEESRRWLRSAAPAAVATYYAILKNPRAKDADRLRAADAIMARCDPITTNQLFEVKHDHVHTHTLSADEVTRRILDLSTKLGVTVPPMLDVTPIAVVEAPAS